MVIGRPSVPVFAENPRPGLSRVTDGGVVAGKRGQPCGLRSIWTHEVKHSELSTEESCKDVADRYMSGSLVYDGMVLVTMMNYLQTIGCLGKALLQSAASALGKKSESAYRAIANYHTTVRVLHLRQLWKKGDVEIM